MTRLADAALRYAAGGWPVFPLAPRRKVPLAAPGHLDATTDPARVRAWWSEHPDANIGFPPGRAGLLVLDLDSEEAKAEAQRLGLFAEPTLIVTTPRGAHLYFKHPGGTVGNRKLRDLIDVRADRGFVVLPPSVHPSGEQYRAVGKIAEIGALPPSVVELLKTPEREAPSPEGGAVIAPPIDSGTPRRRAYVTAAIEAECMELATTGEGGRNAALNRAAFALARFVDTGEADAGKLIELLTFAARNTGLDDGEIDRTISSAFGARGVGV